MVSPSLAIADGSGAIPGSSSRNNGKTGGDVNWFNGQEVVQDWVFSAGEGFSTQQQVPMARVLRGSGGKYLLGQGDGGGNKSMHQLVNDVYTQMPNASSGTVVIAAKNRATSFNVNYNLGRWKNSGDPKNSMENICNTSDWSALKIGKLKDYTKETWTEWHPSAMSSDGAISTANLVQKLRGYSQNPIIMGIDAGFRQDNANHLKELNKKKQQLEKELKEAQAKKSSQSRPTSGYYDSDKDSTQKDEDNTAYYESLVATKEKDLKEVETAIDEFTTLDKKSDKPSKYGRPHITFERFIKFVESSDSSSWLICSGQIFKDPPKSPNPVPPASKAIWKSISTDWHKMPPELGTDQVGKVPFQSQTYQFSTAYTVPWEAAGGKTAPVTNPDGSRVSVPVAGGHSGKCQTEADAILAENQPSIETLDGIAAATEPGRVYNAPLTEHNKKAVAEGGVFDWTVRQKEAAYAGGHLVEDYHYESYTDSKGNTHYYKVHDGWHCEGAYANAPSSPYVIMFWQEMTVHCNKMGFEDVLQRLGGNATHVTRDGNGGQFYGSVVTKESAQVNELLGANGFIETRKQFYDKECPFNCTSSPSGSGAGSNGASQNVSTAVRSLQNNGRSGAWGNDDKSKNTNNFQIFRDGEPVQIDVNLSYPKVDDAVLYKGQKAEKTVITRWMGGTPDTNPKNDDGYFKLATKPGKDAPNLFGYGAPATEQQINTKRITDVITQYPNFAALNGQVQRFWASSDWASEDARPNIVNIKWEYNIDVKNHYTFNGKLNGKNQRLPLSQTDTNTVLDGKCYANFGQPDSINTVYPYYSNTGTGVANNLDMGLIESPGNQWDNLTNLVIRSVRAVSK